MQVGCGQDTGCECSTAERRPSYVELVAALFVLQGRVGRLEAENTELSIDNAVLCQENTGPRDQLRGLGVENAGLHRLSREPSNSQNRPRLIRFEPYRTQDRGAEGPEA